MAAYAVSIFAGAFLLFQVQPMIGKYLLPWFGGATGVWTTCMLFFQVLLLAGYAYAHLSSKLLRPRGQFLLHLILIVLAAATFPITPDSSWKPVEAGDPARRIIALLAVSLGLPYFVLSSTAPLLQHWFSRTHHGTSPFRLYALSNAGSLLALLSYPVVFEVALTRQQQATFWSAGFLLYGAACAWVGRFVWSATQPAGREPANDAENTPSPPARNRAFWLLLPACASVLLLAITNKVCQDVAVIPFLWVLPLSLYLITFIVCFEKPGWYDRRWSVPAFTLSMLASWYLLGATTEPSVALQLSGYSAILFVCCFVAHGEVYRLRPHPAHLTAFYLLIAAGGALGGVFVALVAPLVFQDYYELHTGLIACAVLFLAVLWKQQSTNRAWVRPAFGAGVALLVTMSFNWWQHEQKQGRQTVFRARNFYGVMNVQRKDPGDPAAARLELVHGRVLHGMQFSDPARREWPTLYYVAESGIGRALNLFPAGHRKVGVVGQGAGTLAAYGRPGDVFRFYEINPDVDRAARAPFTFVPSCGAKIDVILGDARLSLERESDQQFDVLALDAFSSDAIPIHLLTREAFQVYQRHTKPSGIVAVHISNMSLDLEPIVLSAARELGFSTHIVEYMGVDFWAPRSTWVLLTQGIDLDKNSPLRRCIRPPFQTEDSQPWTDDFAALFPLLRWKEFFGQGTAKAQALTRAALELEAQLDLSGASDAYRRALKCEPHFTVALNNLAWLLATTTDANLRNGAEAVARAELACTISGYRVPGFIGTLAAAYAEAGRFPEAIAAAEEACALAKAAGEQELLSRNEELLALYRERHPFRERR